MSESPRDPRTVARSAAPPAARLFGIIVIALAGVARGDGTAPTPPPATTPPTAPATPAAKEGPPPPAKPAETSKATPQHFEPTEKTRADFEVSFPVDI